MKTLTSLRILHSGVLRAAQTVRHLTALLLTTISLLALALAPRAAHALIYNTVHDFPTAAGDGSRPIGALVEDPLTGNYYGTTRFGGKSGQGTVFCMNPVSYVVTIIHSFAGADGANPTCTLILVPGTSANGGPATLYGTTLNGGAHGLGTVFTLAVSGAPFNTLYSISVARAER